MAIEAELLAAIAADVDAEAPRLVYADWLLSRGDPRGEVAMLELRAAAQPRDYALVRRLSELQTPVKHRLLGDLPGDVIGAWRLGFVDELTIHRRLVVRVRREPTWFDAIELRFVRRLSQLVTDLGAWGVVEAWTHRGSVRALRHGTTQKRVSREAVDRIAALLPRLTELELHATVMPGLEPLAALPIASLRLDVSHLDAAGMRVLAAMPWRPRRLAIRAQAAPEGLAAFAPLFASALLEEVRELELVGAPALELVEELQRVGRLSALHALSVELDSLRRDTLERLAPLGPQLAAIKLGVPLYGIYSDGSRTARLADVLETVLHRHADALELLEGPWLQGDTLRVYAAALAGLGDPARLAAVLDGPRGSDDLAALAIADAWAAAHGAEQVAAARARALVATGKPREALEVIDRHAAAIPPDTARLLRALADPAAIPELAATTRSATYAALAWLLDGSLARRVPPACVAPPEILTAVLREAGLDAAPGDALDCAELAVIDAARTDGGLAARRSRALAAELDDGRRPRHHDLRVAALALPLTREARTFVGALVGATREPGAPEVIEGLARQYFGPGGS